MLRPIIIIAVGTRHDPDLLQAIHRYERRLPGVITWQLIPASTESDEGARRIESRSIIEKLQTGDFVILLDERGLELTSPRLSQSLERWQQLGKRIVFIIGGAFGVDSILSERADYTWSLSPLVFPHQLVRLILVEQLYRSAMISQGHPYHHR